MELIKSAQSLLSNKTGGGLKDTLVELAKKLVKSYEPKQSTKDRSKSDQKHEIEESKNKPTFTSTVEVKSVTPRLRKEIINRDQGCQFVDLKTGKRCDSEYFLEVDHIQPRYMNGPNTAKNLRVLCKNHNLFRYRENLS